MAKFVNVERWVRNHNEGYSLWQDGVYPFRTLFLECPDGTVWSYDILSQVEQHVLTGKPQTDYPNQVIDEKNADRKEEAKKLEKAAQDAGIDLHDLYCMFLKLNAEG